MSEQGREGAGVVSERPEGKDRPRRASNSRRRAKELKGSRRRERPGRAYFDGGYPVWRGPGVHNGAGPLKADGLGEAFTFSGGLFFSGSGFFLCSDECATSGVFFEGERGAVVIAA